MEDSTAGVVDILRRKLDMDSSQVASLPTTEEKRVDRKQRRKKRPSARKQLKPLISNENGSKEANGSIELVERSDLNGHSSVDELSSHPHRDLLDGNLDGLDPGGSADKDGAAVGSEVDAVTETAIMETIG